MGNKNYLLSQLLDCWYLDVDFLDNLINKFDIEIDIDDLKGRFWNGKIHMNDLIYETFIMIKDKFLNDTKDEIEIITWKTIDDFEDYSIFTNCLDSHLWFNDEKIEILYSNWKESFSGNTY